MKPVPQTIFGESGGNCFSACLASLLELPIDDVPYFMGTHGGAGWRARLSGWLRPMGFWPMFFELDPATTSYRPIGLYILRGPTARGPHAVVACGREIVHDPYPNGGGIFLFEDATLLVPIDPARVMMAAPPTDANHEAGLKEHVNGR